MKLNHRTVTAVITGALLSGSAAFGQSGDAILDLLTKKGVITQREANDVREQLDVQNAQTVEAYNKVKVSSWVNSMQFFGDGRLRYEWRQATGNAGTKATVGFSDNADLDRFRYRLRFGVKGDLLENFSYGLRLETATKGNSANVTMGGNALSGGPWAKGGNNAIEVGQFYAQYKAADWLTLVAGKMENPFMTSAMVWDGDLNPEGFVQKVKFSTDPVDLFLTLGEFTYNNTSAGNNGFKTIAGGNDSWMMGAQVGGKVKISPEMSFTLAPTFYVYVNPNNTAGIFNPTLTNTTAAAGFGDIAGINNLTVFELPAEFAFQFPGIHQPGKVFGEFALNTSATERANRTANYKGYGDQNVAYQIGAAIGKTKKKNDWQVKAYWQHTELFALDPNLVDSDLFDGRLNMQGAVVNGQYLFTDFLSLAITYANAHTINSVIPTLTGAGEMKGNLSNYNLFQADLNWKF